MRSYGAIQMSCSSEFFEKMLWSLLNLQIQCGDVFSKRTFLWFICLTLKFLEKLIRFMRFFFKYLKASKGITLNIYLFCICKILQYFFLLFFRNDLVLCFYCHTQEKGGNLTDQTNKDVYIKKEFSSWKKAPKCFYEHQNSPCHIAVCRCCRIDG